ncbi:MAG TPA: tRNA adenosine(34) deaminase TadA [Thiotrichaceae bacterium]|nr:tRNA adenosine(34) deaminase TadA [Thiotrichaceae bacterium]HIM07721.1 tRNA adenosine(34) deaminase TadA [Gammaproteobacteria bacterium]
MTQDAKWMQRAFELAEKAKSHDEVPVGAVIVFENQIIGEGWNQPISSSDPTAHAEIMALRDAGNNIGNYRLPNTTMYVTLEPCVMCAGAIVHARLEKLVYAAGDPKTGACGSVFNLLQSEELNHKVDIEQGIMENESRSLIQTFFKEKRAK